MVINKHGSFYLRSGWGTKIIQAVDEDEMIFTPANELKAVDNIGLGRVMVKALRYWAFATGLTIEKKLQNGIKMEKTILFQLIDEKDRYFQRLGSLLFLHRNLARNEENATAWYWAFNEFEKQTFTKDEFVDGLHYYLAVHGMTIRKAAVDKELSRTGVVSNESVDEVNRLDDIQFTYFDDGTLSGEPVMNAIYGKLIKAESERLQLSELYNMLKIEPFGLMYTKLSPLQKVQISDNTSKSNSRSQSFAEMDGKQKAAMIGGAAISLGGVIGGTIVGAGLQPQMAMAATGAMIGGQIAGQFSGFINSLAPTEQETTAEARTISTTTENKTITDMMSLLDEMIKKTYEYDSYGLWNVAGYFISDDMSAAEIAASNYRSLMSGEHSGREVSAINSWRRNDVNNWGEFSDLATYLSRYVHPRFEYGGSIIVNPSTTVSGKELGLHLGLPRATVPGLPVIEHAEFGKEVNTYQLIRKNEANRPEDRITIGKIFDLGQITNKVVELNNKSLNMHTFITGSTGSGKSNTVYQMLAELHQDKIPFLVVEPAKGEYKDVFGNWNDVNVYSTNPKVAPLINLNPFMFPESIHVLEHVDGLVEIFGVCWPMYDAMPAFLKDAILKSYERAGWDLGSSTFIGDTIEYPDFEMLADELEQLIENTDYSAEVKGNYKLI